ncbi:hypothetical protein MNAN1_002841 [Malassezia nana]|uniref:Seipin n=1 Tax=Malassezia nana TaxID=180528 RepID=A0AAF0J8A7_9BASI|nr:hypothetical protein MNAN1_002841 [Malassezia nana]
MTARGPVASRPGYAARRHAHRALPKEKKHERTSRMERISDTVHAVLYGLWQAVVVTPTSYICALLYALFLSRTTNRVFLRAIMLLCLQGSCLVLSILAFFSFYHAWVPQVALTKEVWLDYGLPSPSASVLLEQGYGDSPAWRVEPEVDLFVMDQPYDVSLELRVPVSSRNVWVGNFMVDMDLIGYNDTILYQSKRPALLVPEPRPFRWVSRLARALWQPLRSEPMVPLQVVRVPLLRHIVPFASASGRLDDPESVRVLGYKAMRADIRLRLRHAAESLLQVEHAVLRFDAYLTGIPYLMFHYPVFSFGVFLLCFSGVEFLVAGSLWLLAALYYSWCAP